MKNKKTSLRLNWVHKFGNDSCSFCYFYFIFTIEKSEVILFDNRRKSTIIVGYCFKCIKTVYLNIACVFNESKFGKLPINKFISSLNADLFSIQPLKVTRPPTVISPSTNQVFLFHFCSSLTSLVPNRKSHKS